MTEHVIPAQPGFFIKIVGDDTGPIKDDDRRWPVLFWRFRDYCEDLEQHDVLYAIAPVDGTSPIQAKLIMPTGQEVELDVGPGGWIVCGPTIRDRREEAA